MHNDIPTITLYRPVGQNELALIKESDFTRFPPRLPGQPFFYPVCNEKYAREVGNWNNNGVITKFQVRENFLEKYETHIVGSHYHEEYWIPAGELGQFNEAIVGKIEVI